VTHRMPSQSHRNNDAPHAAPVFMLGIGEKGLRITAEPGTGCHVDRVSEAPLLYGGEEGEGKEARSCAWVQYLRDLDLHFSAVADDTDRVTITIRAASGGAPVQDACLQVHRDGELVQRQHFSEDGCATLQGLDIAPYECEITIPARPPVAFILHLHVML